MTQAQELKQKRFEFSLLWNRISLSLLDGGSIVALSCICLYLLLFMPSVLGSSFFAGLLAIAFQLLRLSMQYTAVQWNVRVKPWHVAGVVLLLTIVFSASPAYGQFFNSLEEATKDVVSDADTGVDETLIENIFLFFRVLIVLAFIVGVIVAFSQATRGNDWQPIANLLGIGVAFVIGVEIISILILGDASGGGGDSGDDG